MQLKFQQGLTYILHTGGAYVFETVYGAHGILDALGDIRLYLFRTRTRIHCNDGDIGHIHLGHQLQPHLSPCVQTQEKQADDETGHGNGSFQRGIG